MCRKFTGSILPQNFNVPTQNISPPLASNPSFKLYKSSSFGKRGFCSICGSSITFSYDKKPDHTEIYIGVLDEEVLCGKRDEANAWEDAHGRHIPRIGGLGKEICYTER